MAARENAISPATLKDLQGLVKAIALNTKIEESRDFAHLRCTSRMIAAESRPGQPGIQDRGVRTAPFYVLIGATMPSVLAEISFLSNPARRDATPPLPRRQREKIASEPVSKGVRAYLEGLNRTQPRQLTRNAAPRRTVNRKEKRSGVESIFPFTKLVPEIIWVKVEKPTFDLVGVVLGSLSLAGVLLLLAARPRAACSARRCCAARRRAAETPIESVSLRLDTR